MRINNLPNWCIPDSIPAFYDTDSKSVLDQTAKLYGIIKKLVADYNEYAKELDKGMDNFEEEIKKLQSEFEEKMIKIIHDYISMLDGKLALQDKEIEENIVYIKNNIGGEVTRIIDEMKASGELDAIIADSLDSVNERLLLLESDVHTLKDSLDTLTPKILENETDIEVLKENTVNLDKRIESTQSNLSNLYVDNVEDMKNTQLEVGNVVKTLGYYEINDGGEATYIIRTKNENDVEDNGSIHFISNNLVAELINNGKVNVKQYGAKGDGENDDTQSITNACLFAKNHDLMLFIPKTDSCYNVSILSIDDITHIKISGVIKPTNYIEIKGNVNRGNHSNIDIYYIDGELRMYGLNTAVVKINRCKTLKLLATNEENIRFISYSHFYLGRIGNLIISSDYEGKYVNENIFIGGRFINLTIEGSYSHQDNLFIKPMFENSTITINNGDRNRFLNCRLEGTNTINCAENTKGNYFEKTFFEIERSMYSKFQSNTEFNDSGNNIYIKNTGTKSENIISLNEYNNPYSLPITNHKITPTGNYSVLYESAIVEIPEKPIALEFLNPDQKVDFTIYAYDENQNVITENMSGIISPMMKFSTNGYYNFSVKTVEKAIAMVYPNKNIKYIKIKLTGMGSAMTIGNLEVRVSYKESDSIQKFIDGFKTPISNS